MAKDTGLAIKDFLIPASQLHEDPDQIYPTFLSMDIGLSGGIPAGVCVYLAGKQKTGKTSFVLHCISQAQKKNPDIKAYWFDAEGRLRRGFLDCFKDLDLDRFNLIRSNENKILTAEDYLNLLDTAIKDYPNSICVLDSIAALCPEVEIGSVIGDSKRRASIPTLTYELFRRYSQILTVSKNILFLLTHMISNPSGMGKSSRAVGGNSSQYGASIWLEIPYKTDIVEGSDNRLVGQIAHVNVVSSALGPPAKEIEMPIIFGNGIDMMVDLYKLLIEFGLLSTAGAGWHTMPNDQTVPELKGKLPEDFKEKLQGKEKVIDYLRTNTEYAAVLDSYIRKMAIAL